MCVTKGKRIASENKFCNTFFWIYRWDFLFFSYTTWLITHPSVHVFSLQTSLSWMAAEKRLVTIANLCWGLGVHKVWRMGDCAHVDVPLLHLTGTTSFWCHPSVHVGVNEVHIVSPPEETLSRTHRRNQSKLPWDQVSDIINLMLPSRGSCGFMCYKSIW